jgi:hypothetical protein
LASWAENGSPSSGAWAVPDYLEVVECKVAEKEEDEFLEAVVVRSKFCAASLRIDKKCVVKKGNWCDECNNAAMDVSALVHIVKLVQKLDRLAIAEEKMMSSPGGMQKCIRKAQSHEYFDDGKIFKPQWLQSCLVKSDHWHRLEQSTLAEDKECLVNLNCVGQKDDAFVRICEYNVALLTHSRPDS